MSYRNGRDRLWLIWKEPETRRQFVVGEMEKNGQYTFRYSSDIQHLIDIGFNLLMPFQDIEKVYESAVLFPIFSSRLPDRKRADMNIILARYGMKEYDEYTLLKMSGARLPIDSFEFVDPIFEDETGEILRSFHVAGSRHYLNCETTGCGDAVGIKEGISLQMVPEPENEYDTNAIKLVTESGIHVGYLPRYYCKPVLHYAELGREIVVQVIGRGEEKQCDICIRASIDIKE